MVDLLVHTPIGMILRVTHVIPRTLKSVAQLSNQQSKCENHFKMSHPLTTAGHDAIT